MAIDAPLALHSESIRPEWIDYNGHMNVAYYSLIFDHAADALFDFLGIGQDYTKRTNHSIFILDARILFLRELTAGQRVRCTTQLLDFDPKRVHYCFQMEHLEEGWKAALFEGVSVHVDLGSRRTAPMPAAVLDLLERLKRAHQVLTKPGQFDRTLGLDQGERG